MSVQRNALHYFSFLGVYLSLRERIFPSHWNLSNFEDSAQVRNTVNFTLLQ